MALPKVTRPLLLLFLAGATLALASKGGDDDGHSHGDDDDSLTAAQVEAAALAAAEALEDRIQTTHGVLGCLAFAAFFPAGAIALRLLPGRLSLLVHIVFQLFALTLALVTMALGLWMAWENPYMGTYHAIIGIVAVAGVFFQPFSGFLHHHFFKRLQQRTITSYLHLLGGFSFITLGTINGGFGLALGGVEKKYMVVYGVFAGLIWLVWMAVSSFAQLRRGKKAAQHEHAKAKEGSPDRETKAVDDRRENYA